MLSDGRICDEELDGLALLARQDYNLGNKGDWFFNFRGGMSGFRSRMMSLDENRRLVYEWHPRALINGHEKHVAIMLFSMDSALECVVFAINALGFARDPAGFRDVQDAAALKRISPNDVLGTKGTPYGYARLFPRFQEHVSKSSKLIRLIQDNHDVSKHRQDGFWGGECRADPPPDFFERLGLALEHPARSAIAPMASVLLPLYPKLPIDVLSPDLEAWTRLEVVIEDFRAFINEAVCQAYQDALVALNLPVRAFRE